MSEISYRRIDYTSDGDKVQIIRMYKEVFNIDFEEGYNFWFESNSRMNPIGIIAFCKTSGKVVGHFATIKIIVNIAGGKMCGRLSMGFMTDENYRGMGIATELYKRLKKELLLEGETTFVIGFPNDMSLKLHIDKMDYELVRDYNFITFPYKKTNQSFTKIETVKRNYKENKLKFNILHHENSFLNWRFSKSQYLKYISDDGKVYVCTRFLDKMDILYWDINATEEDLIDFAGFLYRDSGVKKVSTWNSTLFLNKYPKDERKYHMCINYLDCDSELRERIRKNDWLFYMGDCELF